MLRPGNRCPVQYKDDDYKYVNTFLSRDDLCLKCEGLSSYSNNYVPVHTYVDYV